MKTLNRGLASTLAMGCLLAASTASAQTIGGKFKLGLETDIFGYRSITPDQPAGSDESVSQLSFGFGPSDVVSPLGAAFPRTAGVDLGYGVSNDVELGVRLGLGVSKADTGSGGGDISMLSMSATPHVDYVFGAGNEARPFIGGLLGMGMVDLDDSLDTSLFSFGVEGGVHGFVVEGLSIDPRLQLAYGLGSISMGNAEVDFDMISVTLGLGISGWM